MEGKSGREKMEEWKVGRLGQEIVLPVSHPSNHRSFHPSIRPFFLYELIRALLLFGACAWAWKSAGGSFANLWLTPDQQGGSAAGATAVC
jgi:hypothetical protein